MSEPTEKTSGTPDNTAETNTEIPETEAKADEMPTESQENVATAEEKSEAKSKEEAKEKPLEKMTVKELREIAKDIPGITGVHAMKKEELINGIKEARGIKDEPLKKAVGSMRELKLKIKALKAERQAALEANNKKMATVYKRRISRLKKKTRRAAA